MKPRSGCQLRGFLQLKWKKEEGRGCVTTVMISGLQSINVRGLSCFLLEGLDFGLELNQGDYRIEWRVISRSSAARQSWRGSRNYLVCSHW